MKKIFAMLTILLLSTLINAKSTTQQIGDVLAAAIPLGGYGATLYFDDKEGGYEFFKSYGTAIATTYALKYTVREKRPDTDEKDSFPSGHTSSAFSGASFIHKKYGLKYAIIPYLGAIYTGYSRVDSNRHHTHDVIAGALIGIASSWYFTTPYKNVVIKPIVGADYKGLQIGYKW